MLTFFTIVIWLLGIAMPILLGLWAYFNAEMRQVKNPGIWGVLVATVPFFIGWIVYMFYRVGNGVAPLRTKEPAADANSADWASFGAAAVTQDEIKSIDNRAICSKLLIIYWICFVITLVISMFTIYLFITSLAAVLMASLGSVSSGINGVLSQIPQLMP